MSVAAAANALATKEDVKYVLGKAQTDTTQDDRIQTLINLVSGRAEAWCGRVFKEATYTDELYDGDNDSILLLRNYPSNEIIAVSIDGVSVDMSDPLTFQLYKEEGYIWYSPGFSAGRQNVKVTYKGGYASLPSGLSEIIIEWVIILFEGRMKDAKVKGEDVRTYMPDQIEMGLSSYKRRDF